MTQRSGDNKQGAMGLIIAIAVCGLVIAGVLTFTASVRRQNRQWLELTSVGIEVAKRFVSDVRAGHFEQARQSASKEFQATLDDKTLAELRTDFEKLADPFVPLGWIIQGGSSQFQWGLTGPRLDSKPPVLIFRLAFKPELGKNEEITVQVTYEQDRIVIKRVDLGDQIVETPSPPPRPQPSTALPKTGQTR